MEHTLQLLVQELFGVEIEVVLARTDEQFGDFSTNVAMQLAGKLGKNPREVADAIAAKLHALPDITEVAVAGPGFINVRLSDVALLAMSQRQPEQVYKGQIIVCEYSDMNAFKTAHVGHLYTTLVGDVIANLCEIAGARVVRANFGGDVGLHVAKAMWGIVRAIGSDPSKLETVEPAQRSAWVAARYVEGNDAYESDEATKAEIDALNRQVYELHQTGDRESDFARVYWTCRTWSYEGFEQFYSMLGLGKQPDGTHFVYYPESETAPFGVEVVNEGKQKGIFVESNGALVYEGEKAGLHTRVFLTAAGLPTYETKDLGLAVKKWQDYHYDRSIIITANDITAYMKVILCALREFDPVYAERTTHITHGLVKLAGGQKMSSRKGNVLLPEDVIETAQSASEAATGKTDLQSVLGAIRYAFLKNRIGGDIIYDPAESVSIHGNSGPYLQYAHARACSILAKVEGGERLKVEAISDLQAGERTLVRKLGEYAEVVEQAAGEFAPHLLCTYLYELAQVFNVFYENNTVIGDERQATRLALVELYRDTLARGLAILGITAPEQM